MKFKVPIRRKKNRSTATEEEVAAALAGPAPEPAAVEAPAAEPAADTPAEANTAPATEPETEQSAVSEPLEVPAAEETPAEETPAEETPAEETPAEEAPAEETPAEETAEEETAEEETVAEETVEETPQEVEQPEEETEIAPEPQEEEEETFADAEQDPPTQDEAATPTALEPEEITDNGTDECNQFNDDSTDSGVSVELAPVPPMFGILKKGPYMVANATPKMMKTLKKQKWSSQFCRIDPSLLQIFCCDKDRGKLYETFAPVETDGKCMFFHISTYTTVQEGIEEDAKAKEFSFKITGLNGGPENTLTMSTSSVDEREKWVKVIRRAVTRMHIDQDRVGEHTKLRQMLTAQEAEISILEEELEKMAVVAGECAGRASLAEEKLSLKRAEADDVEGKLSLATLEITSLRSQIAIMEERTRNLNILADDVNGVTPEEVEAAREQMQKQRTARLKAIQLEIGADEDYLEKYKKYLNLKRDSILQKHGSQFSINNMGLGQPKVSPSTVTAPMSMN